MNSRTYDKPTTTGGKFFVVRRAAAHLVRRVTCTNLGKILLEGLQQPRTAAHFRVTRAWLMSAVNECRLSRKEVA
jgi:hypothetical protein